MDKVACKCTVKQMGD